MVAHEEIGRDSERVVPSGGEATGVSDNRYSILIPILESDHKTREEDDIRRLLDTGHAIARAHDGELYLVNIVLFPEQTPLKYVRNEDHVETARRATTQLLDSVSETHPEIPVRGCVYLAHTEKRAILRMIDKQSSAAILLGTRNTTGQRRRLLQRDTVERLLMDAPCDVFVERFGREPFVEELGSPSTRISRILVAVTDSPHSALAVETANALAMETNAQIELVHGIAMEASEEDVTQARERINEIASPFKRIATITTTLIQASNLAEELIIRSNNHDITIIGATRDSLIRQFVFGSLPEQVRIGAENTVLMTKRK